MPQRDSNDCTKFYICEKDGEFHTFVCPEGYIFEYGNVTNATTRIAAYSKYNLALTIPLTARWLRNALATPCCHATAPSIAVHGATHELTKHEKTVSGKLKT